MDSFIKSKIPVLGTLKQEDHPKFEASLTLTPWYTDTMSEKKNLYMEAHKS